MRCFCGECRRFPGPPGAAERVMPPLRAWGRCRISELTVPGTCAVLSTTKNPMGSRKGSSKAATQIPKSSVFKPLISRGTRPSGHLTLQSPVHYDKVPQTGYLFNNSSLCLTVREAGNPTSGCQQGPVPVRTFWEAGGRFLCLHRVTWGRELFGVPYEITNPIHEVSTLPP